MAIFEAFDTNGVLRHAYESLLDFKAYAKLFLVMVPIDYIAIPFFYCKYEFYLVYAYIPVVILEGIFVGIGIHAIKNEKFNWLVAF